MVEDKLNEMISKLNTAVGMLLIPSISNPEVKEAMEMVTKVAIEIRELEIN